MGTDVHQKYQNDRGEVIGSIIIEQIDAVQSRDIVGPRAELVCQHSARALGNAMEHNNLFLMGLWKTLGNSRVLVTAKHLPKTLLVSGLVLGTLLALILVPKEFQLKAEGTLEPVVRQDVFFQASGQVETVHVDHGDLVNEGDPLVILASTEVKQEEIQLNAQLLAARQRRDAISRRIERAGDADGTLWPTLVELDQQIIGYVNQLEILQDKLRKLRVEAPISGEIATWEVRKKLRERPVVVGEVAMQMFDPDQDWELLVFLADKRIGHLLRAQRDKKSENLDVNFVVESHSGESFRGQLETIQDAATLPRRTRSLVSLARQDRQGRDPEPTQPRGIEQGR